MDPSPLHGGLSNFIINEVRDFAIYLIDPSGTVLTWSEGARANLGYTADEIVGRPFDLFFTEADRAAGVPQAELRRATETGRSEHIGWRVRKDGSRFWGDEIMTAVRDGEAEPRRVSGFVKITRDLSHRKAVEDAARASEVRYRTVVEGVTDYAILLLDPENRITGWNTGARHIFHYDEPEVLGKPASIIFTPEDRARGEVERELGSALRNGRAEDERWHLRKDGSRFFASGVMTSLRDDAGGLIGFTKILRDITQRQQEQEALKAVNETLEQRVADRTAALVTYQQQLRSLVLQLARSEQRQRRDLATELHDHLVQTLALCRIKAGMLANGLSPERTTAEATQVKLYLDQALAYTRTLMADLSPTVLNRDDLRAAIDHVAQRMKQHRLTVTVEDDGLEKPLDEQWLALMFQGTRELLFNVLKHAGTNQATVVLAREEHEVRVTVVDRGAGFTVDPARLTPSAEGHYGLFNLRERVDLMGGRLEISSSPGQGTRATLVAPIGQRV